MRLLAVVVWLWTFEVQAAITGPKIATGSLSGGFATPQIISPSKDAKIENGRIFSIEGEKDLNFFFFNLVTSVQYFSTTGTVNYDYISPSKTHYEASEIGYSMDKFQGGLGARFRPFQHLNTKPFFGGGFTGGYNQLSYDQTLSRSKVVSMGGDYKTVEGVLDFGTYAEVGFDYDITSEAGLRTSYRYTDSTTRNLETLGGRPLNYAGAIYSLGFFLDF